MLTAEQWTDYLGEGDALPTSVERFARRTAVLVRANEALVRGALLLSLQQWTKVQAGEDLGEAPIKRGGRLVGVRAALAPFEKRLGAAALCRLAIALSLLSGVESRIVLRDIWNLDDEEA